MNNTRSVRIAAAGRRRLWLFRGAAVLLCWAVLEALSLFAVSYLQRQKIVYAPARNVDYPAYLAKRDPVLGWPARGPDPDRDRFGARLSVAFPDPEAQPALVSIYGDSFTWSSEVDHRYAWPDVLSTMLGSRVDNFGVGGYGSDQALLRFESNRNERARIVILVHLTENILRNVNQYRDLLYYAGGCAFKPRFIVDSQGALELIPQPDISLERFPRFLEAPEKFLPHEAFAPGQPAGPIRAGLPFTLTVLRSFGHFHVVAKLRGVPWHAPFYAPQHGAQGLEVTAKIMARFHREAVQRGQQPVLAILPTGRDLEYHQRTGTWVYAPLVEELHSRQLPLLDFGPELIEKIGAQPLEDFFGSLSAHPNARGYRLVAGVAYEYLTTHDLVSGCPQPDQSDALTEVAR